VEDIARTACPSSRVARSQAISTDSPSGRGEAAEGGGENPTTRSFWLTLPRNNPSLSAGLSAHGASPMYITYSGQDVLLEIYIGDAPCADNPAEREGLFRGSVSQNDRVVGPQCIRGHLRSWEEPVEEDISSVVPYRVEFRIEVQQLGDYSEEALAKTTELLDLNPEFYTIWNYRRNILLNGLFPAS
jgi:hypothetical protein